MSREIIKPEHGETTPGGGVVAEVYYFDEEGKPAPKTGATRVMIRELNAKGDLVRETHGTKEAPRS